MLKSATFKLLVPLLFIFAVGSASADVFDEILERGSIRVGVAEFAP